MTVTARAGLGADEYGVGRAGITLHTLRLAAWPGRSRRSRGRGEFRHQHLYSTITITITVRELAVLDLEL